MSGSVNEGDMRERSFTPSGSSAPPAQPTADVEKIALRLCENLGCTLDSMAYVNIRESLAQARAPLVEALEDIAWGGNRPVDELRSIACVALTGAGEEPTGKRHGRKKLPSNLGKKKGD